MFDYTFYRTAKRHFKRDGIESFSGLLAISFIIYLYLLSIYILISKLFNLNIIHKTSVLEKGIIVSIMILIYILVSKKYKGKYLFFREKWINETKTEKLIGELLIILFFFSPVILIGIINIVFKN